MGADFTFTKWRMRSHARYPIGNTSLQMYDSSTGVYGDVLESGIVGRATDRLQESDVFDAVTASKWKLVATTGLHSDHVHICDVEFFGVEETTTAFVGAAAADGAAVPKEAEEAAAAGEVGAELKKNVGDEEKRLGSRSIEAAPGKVE